MPKRNRTPAAKNDRKRNAPHPETTPATAPNDTVILLTLTSPTPGSHDPSATMLAIFVQPGYTPTVKLQPAALSLFASDSPNNSVCTFEDFQKFNPPGTLSVQPFFHNGPFECPTGHRISVSDFVFTNDDNGTRGMIPILPPTHKDLFVITSEGPRLQQPMEFLHSIGPLTLIPALIGEESRIYIDHNNKLVAELPSVGDQMFVPGMIPPTPGLISFTENILQSLMIHEHPIFSVLQKATIISLPLQAKYNNKILTGSIVHSEWVVKCFSINVSGEPCTLVHQNSNK